MKNLRMILMTSILGLSTGLALAQPAGSKGPSTTQSSTSTSPAASGPGMGMGSGMGGGMGAGMGSGPHHGRGAMRWGKDYTPGWSMMTEQERNEHRERMRSMKTYEECKAYVDKHHEEMAARAKEKGMTLHQPRRDPCAGLKK